MSEVLCYQGVERRELLRFLHRFCLRRRAGLLAALCRDTDAGLAEAVRDWLAHLCHDLEERIRASRQHTSREALALSLLYDADGLARVLDGSRSSLCTAWRSTDEHFAARILGNLLQQYFKRKMDELDAFGAGHGAHILTVRRRIEALKRELEEQRGAPYPNLPVLAADILETIRARGLSNLPGTVEKIMDYLYEIRGQEDSIDIWEDTSVVVERDDPALLALVEQCLENLPAPHQEILVTLFGIPGTHTSFAGEEDY